MGVLPAIYHKVSYGVWILSHETKKCFLSSTFHFVPDGITKDAYLCSAILNPELAHYIKAKCRVPSRADCMAPPYQKCKSETVWRCKAVGLLCMVSRAHWAHTSMCIFSIPSCKANRLTPLQGWWDARVCRLSSLHFLSCAPLVQRRFDAQLYASLHPIPLLSNRRFDNLIISFTPLHLMHLLSNSQSEWNSKGVELRWIRKKVIKSTIWKKWYGVHLISRYVVQRYGDD